MKRILAILIGGLLMIMATAAIVYAGEEDDDGAESAPENETEEKETTGEADSIPGFEIAFAAASLGAARLLRYRNS